MQRALTRLFISTTAVVLTLPFVPHRVAAQDLVPNKASDLRPSLDNPLASWGSEYTNWVELSVGGFAVHNGGSSAALQRRHQLPATAFGGIESLHFEQPLATNRTFILDGRGIFDNHDYELRLELRQENLGFIRGGYREFRTWYDQEGGYFPPDRLWLTPFAREGAVDRGDAWIELGLRLPNIPEVTLRYDHEFRTGSKDSLNWGDITTSRGVRSIVPSLYNLDETRDIFQLNVKHTISATEITAGARYESISQDDQKLILRQPGAAVGSANVTQNNVSDTDVFNAHASSSTRFNERFLLTASYAFTLFDNDVSGSRIYGAGFEAVYDPTFRGAQHYEGFLGLSGSGTMREHLGNVSLLYNPTPTISIVPALRISSQDESANSTYALTDFSAAGLATGPDATSGWNDRDYLEVGESLEFRYTGLTNWVLYARGEWSEDNGRLRQQEIPLAAPEDSDLLDEDVDRFTQKYILGANWYPLARLNFAAQYYHKLRDANYENRLPGGPPPAYPGFIQEQKFDVDDVNFRVTLRPLNSLTLVTRYDFQLSTIDTAGNSGGLGVVDIQSGETTTHIISQSVSWTPIEKLFLQGSFSYVLDETTSGANRWPPANNIVLPTQNDYWNVSALVGLVLDDRTDLQLQYYYYRANDYANNSFFSQPYGAGAEENGITATFARQLTRAMRWSLKYGFFTNHDVTYGGHNNYKAHLVYSSIQYRF